MHHNLSLMDDGYSEPTLYKLQKFQLNINFNIDLNKNFKGIVFLQKKKKLHIVRIFLFSNVNPDGWQSG